MPAEAIPAFQDNYLWLLSSRGKGVLVDPGDAGPVMEALESRQLELSTILITHHHADHIGGVAELRSAWPMSKCSDPRTRESRPTFRVSEGMTVSLEALGLGTFEVLEVPGHTRSHIAYYGGWRSLLRRYGVRVRLRAPVRGNPGADAFLLVQDPPLAGRDPGVLRA